MSPRKASISDRRNKTERQISDDHVGNFCIDGSQAESFLNRLLGDDSQGVTRKSLVLLAVIFSELSGILFYRDFSRRRVLVFKWFDDHLEALQSIAPILNIGIAPCDIARHPPHSPDCESSDDSS
jgi:hypothetical protein